MFGISHRLLITILYAAVGIMFSLGSIPFIRERVAPNPYFGFRTAKTFSDTRIWFEANRIMGYDLLFAGVAITVGAIALYIWSGRAPTLPIAKANLIIFVISLVLAAVHSYWRLGRL